jgi:hypothetical protein
VGQAAINHAYREALLNQESRRAVLDSCDLSPYVRDQILKMDSYQHLSTLASDLFNQYFH